MLRILSAMILMVLVLGCEEEQPKDGIDRKGTLQESACDWGYEYDDLCWVYVCVDQDSCSHLGKEWRPITSAEKESLLDLCQGNIDPLYRTNNNEDDLTEEELSLCYDCRFIKPLEVDENEQGGCVYSPWELNSLDCEEYVSDEHEDIWDVLSLCVRKI